MKKRAGLSLEESKLLTRITTMGTGTNLPVVMTLGELSKVIGVIYSDTGTSERLVNDWPQVWEWIQPPAVDYYSLPDDWFMAEVAVNPEDAIRLLRAGHAHIPDFRTYLLCLSELHKRRRKYSMILSAQPLPMMVQVAPRSLMEYGNVDPEALASWLTWRKFFYDLDNRSAQETGYLFEPILAEAIGGEPKNAKARVVRRTADDSKGRQVDCWKVVPGGKPLAYEFKLRVTIAASGQGRFKEELEFAEDCFNSGAVPVLVVLDPTPNPRLSELEAAFRRSGGHAYIGDAAWAHLEDEAGDVMARFIEKYVRTPLSRVTAFENGGGNRLRLLDLEAKIAGSELVLKLGNHAPRQIARREDPSLSEDAGDGPENEADNGSQPRLPI